MKCKYYLIFNSDGDTYINEHTKESLTELINEENGPDKFLDDMRENDTNYWGDNHLIIKGRIIVPKDEKMVIRRVIE